MVQTGSFERFLLPKALQNDISFKMEWTDSPNKFVRCHYIYIYISTPQSSTITSRHKGDSEGASRKHMSQLQEWKLKEKVRFHEICSTPPHQIQSRPCHSSGREFVFSPWLFVLQVESCWRLMSQRRRNWQKKASKNFAPSTVTSRGPWLSFKRKSNNPRVPGVHLFSGHL